jgi:hypothetical protein
MLQRDLAWTRSGSALPAWAKLLALQVRRDRGQVLGLLANVLVLPVAVAYMGLVLLPEGSDLRARWLCGSLVVACGGSCLGSTFARAATDRWTGSGQLLATLPIGVTAYVGVLLSYAVMQALLVLGSGVLLLGVTGEVALGAVATLDLALVAVLTGLTLGGLGVGLAFLAPSPGGGDVLVGVAGLALAVISPVFYSQSVLPPALGLLAQLSPYTHISELLLAAAGHGPQSNLSLLGLTMFAAGGVWLALARSRLRVG